MTGELQQASSKQRKHERFNGIEDRSAERLH
jgi:hypothetical protein